MPLLTTASSTRDGDSLAVLWIMLIGWFGRDGRADTYPYHPDGFGYRGSDYRNGGIWPWLNHAHAWGLFKLGERAEGIEILKRMARANLEMAGDFLPHEYLNGETGQQPGVPMQGWNAAMFGAIYFGLNRGSAAP